MKNDHKTLRKHFIESLHTTLDGVISPTPYLEIVEGDRVDVRFLNGKGRLPSPGATEVTILDIDAASLFFDDFHILYEGVTGIGKTYTSDALFTAIFGPEGHYTMRLSGGVLGSSALEPFTKTTLDGGVPKTRIDHEKCAQYGALFADEINRGDSQETFQVVDGKIHVNGDTGYLRIPIPGTDRYKSLAIIAAMNPADAEHSSALELDIAGENRFLKFRFPNGVAEAASSQLDKRVGGDLHEKFWSEYRKRTGLKGSWRELYPVVADGEAIPSELDGATREFIDVALGYVGANPLETFQRNKELMEQGGLAPRFTVQNDNNLKKILEAQHSLKHGFVRRDLRKIENLSRLLGFIKGVKNGTYDTTVSLNDVAVSIGVVLESKTVTNAEHGPLMNLVNDALTAYKGMLQTMKIPDGFGMRQSLWTSGVYAGQDHDYAAYVNTLEQGAAGLNTQLRSAAQATIMSRVLADLTVLGHFNRSYTPDVTAALKEKDAFAALIGVYEQHKARSSIYEHRLGSIIR